MLFFISEHNVCSIAPELPEKASSKQVACTYAVIKEKASFFSVFQCFFGIPIFSETHTLSNVIPGKLQIETAVN